MVARLTKRQKQILKEYSTDEWLMVFGVDYRVVVNLHYKGLLDFDHVTHSCRAVFNDVQTKHVYIFVGTSSGGPVVRTGGVEVKSTKEFDKYYKIFVENYVKLYGGFKKDLYCDCVAVYETDILATAPVVKTNVVFVDLNELAGLPIDASERLRLR